MKKQNSTLFAAYATAQRTRTLMTTMLAGTFVLAQVVPTYATIDNTANAVGTYNGLTTTYGADTKNVPVAPAAPSLTIVKTAAAPTTGSGTDTLHTDAGDTITYTYVVKNTGTVTMNSVAPTDAGPSFNGTAGTLSLSAFTPASVLLAPGISQTFTATYTLSQLDVLHGAGVANGVVNTAGAGGTYGPTNLPYTIPLASQSTAKTAIVAYPQLTIAKTFALVKGGSNVIAGKAELGDTVNYTYVSCNTGNVKMTNVSVLDTHVGVVVAVGGSGITGETLTTNGPLGALASTDATANTGIWDSLAAGGCVTFTWAHVVTQAEVNAG